MKLYAIEHDTREDGCGTLNGELFKTFKQAVVKIEQFTHTKHGTSFDFGDMGWIKRDEYCDEDNTIIIYEKEVDV